MSSAKRLCTSLAMGKVRQWLPIVDPTDLRLPPLQAMFVGKVKDRRLTAEVLLLLKSIYPWPKTLKHVRRLNQINEELEILLYPSSHLPQLDEQSREKYFHPDGFRSTFIPVESCSLRWQHEQCLREHWPNLAFRENSSLEQTQRAKEINQRDEHILQLLQKCEEENVDRPCAVIVDESDGSVLVAARDSRVVHPLHHCTMVGIDLLGVRPISSPLDLWEKKERSGHLLTGCSIYLSREPCVMCAMALLHSRISTVYFLERNVHHGALASNYQLHTLKKTNHRFLVYQLDED